ncbi:MAG: hypothetical protein JWQ35_417 [Bacteriovoracaceae bacterium]|nr:hypothetical protein [Bacteriovoracaceae bacterium]
MEQLQIYKQGEKILSLTMDKNLIRLGRSSPCEIELPDPSLSRQHCLLVKKEKTWFIEDSSKNGVYLESGESVNGRVRLENKKKYKLGRLYSFEMHEQPGQNSAIDKTIVLGASPTQLISLDTKKITVGKAEICGTRLDSSHFRYEIRSDGLTVGNHSGNDICIESPSVSQFHARIDFIDNHYTLSDLASTNGTFLNGVRIVKALIPDGGKIQIGPFDLQFLIRKEEIPLVPKKSNRFLDMVSENKQMKTVFSTIEVVAGTDASVVIHGETGTGKELVARALHNLSRRDHFPFVALNCAALPKDLVESELFGHEKGSFTGASTTQIGAFEAAHQGTLFLDEVAELDLSIQAKLLRALESKEIKRVGATKTIPISLRLVSATHKNLLDEVRKGKFREDLFYRLHVIQIELPALKDRLEDLAVLVNDLLLQLKFEFAVEPKVIDFLKSYAFPGNIRELKNILQRAAIEFEVRSIAEDKQLEKILLIEDFSFLKGSGACLLTEDQQFEKNQMLDALKKNDFVQTKVAKVLNIPISTLNDKIKRYGIQLAK